MKREEVNISLPSVNFCLVILSFINLYHEDLDSGAIDNKTADSDQGKLAAKIACYISCVGFPPGSVVKNPPAGRHGFDPSPGKISWRRKWQPTPVFLLGEPHGAWRATVHGSQKSWPPPSGWTAARCGAWGTLKCVQRSLVPSLLVAMRYRNILPSDPHRLPTSEAKVPPACTLPISWMALWPFLCSNTAQLLFHPSSCRDSLSSFPWPIILCVKLTWPWDAQKTGKASFLDVSVRVSARA